MKMKAINEFAPAKPSRPADANIPADKYTIVFVWHDDYYAIESTHDDRDQAMDRLFKLVRTDTDRSSFATNTCYMILFNGQPIYRIMAM